MRGHHRVAIVVLGIGSLLFGLTGCVGSGSAAPSNTASTSATATATPASNAPVSRVSLTCEDLADTSAFVAQFGVPLTPTAPSELSLVPAAQQQYGTLRCDWSAGSKAENILLSITVVPDVSDASWAAYTQYGAGDGSVRGAYPGDSTSSCSGGISGRTCTLDTRIGTWWLAVTASSSQPQGSDDLAAWGHPILSRAATAVSTLGTAPTRWMPVAPDSTPASCQELDSAVNWETATGASNVSGEFAGPSPEAGAPWLAELQTGYLICSYSTSSGGGFTIELLPNGAWSWNALLASAADFGGATPVRSLGDQAFSVASATKAVVAVWSKGSIALVAADSGGGAANGAHYLAVARGAAAAIVGVIH